MKTSGHTKAAALLALSLVGGAVAPALATNTYTMSDPQEIPYASGYDIKEITFTLNPDFSLTAEIIPYGVPGDADGDGDPNASSNPLVIDEPGVGEQEFLLMSMECGATDVSNGCIPNVDITYNGNVLTVYNNIPVTTPLDQFVTFDVLVDRYVMTITDLAAFKAALGISATAVNFGAFSFSSSFTDNQEDDLVPDNGNCEAVHLDPPVVATCNLVLEKVSSVATVGPLMAPVGNEDDDDDSDSDSHQDTNYSGDSDDSDTGMDLACGCRGKVSELTLRYTGTTPTTVQVDRIDPFGTNLMPATPILPGDVFTVSGSSYGPHGFKGTLGVGIVITTTSGEPVQIHTSCSEPVGPGLVAGDFVVESGTSKKLSKPLCPVVSEVCPANQQVTYTYTITNNGTDLTDVVITDNKMVDPVGGPISLAANASQVFTADACLYETTTNIASATGTLSNGLACASNEASVTVEMLAPPPVECITGVDCNDDDGTVTPPPPPEYQGCGPDYWEDHKRHKQGWRMHSPDDRFDAVFGVDSAGNKGLLKVLKEKDLRGRGAGSKDLQRQAAAALLNASHPEVHYFYTPGEVVAIVVNAYETKNFDAARDLLKAQNELSCPLGDQD